jgi:hypothetical protein
LNLAAELGMTWAQLQQQMTEAELALWRIRARMLEEQRLKSPV